MAFTLKGIPALSLTALWALSSLPGANAERVCTTDVFGVTHCRNRLSSTIKIIVGASILGALILFLGIGAFIKNRRAKRLAATVDSNQIQGPPPMQSFNPTMIPQGSYDITAPPGTYAPPAGYPAPTGSTYPFNGYSSDSQMPPATYMYSGAGQPGVHKETV